MKVYKENIQRFNQFYNSAYYRLLQTTSPSSIEVIFTTLSWDPDARDIELYRVLSQRYDFAPLEKVTPTHLEVEVAGQRIRLSADIVCGRKQLVKLHNGDFNKWLEDYKRVRGNSDLHFIWPKHKLPTINTQRYVAYLDRIDCLLYDLKLYFEQPKLKTPMSPAYQQEFTKLWLQQFKDFKDFVQKMKFDEFVDENYEVYDLELNDGTVIRDIKSIQDIRLSINRYLRNMIDKHGISRLNL